MWKLNAGSQADNSVWRTVKYLMFFTGLLLDSDLTDASVVQSLWETWSRRENQTNNAGNLLTIWRIFPRLSVEGSDQDWARKSERRVVTCLRLSPVRSQESLLAQ